MLIVLALFAAGKFYWSEQYPAETWRYKMTVSVETPEGVKTGSAVREVTGISGPKLLPEAPSGGARVKGEAVVVDLGKRGILFALMRSKLFNVDYAYDIVFEAFPFRGALTPAGIRYYHSLKSSEKIVLHPAQYPEFAKLIVDNGQLTMARVLDFNLCEDKTDDGKCLQFASVVNMKESDKEYYVTEDRFEELYGKGVKIKEVTIEMTDEPVTHGIRKILPPFGDQPHIFTLNDFVSRDMP